MMGKIWVKESNQYPSKLGIKKIDLNDFKINDKKNFLRDLDKRLKNYDLFIKFNLRHDRNKLGMNKVIKEINSI